MKIRALTMVLLVASLAAGTLGLAADKPVGADAPKKNVDKGVLKVKLDGEISKLDLSDAQKADIAKLRADLRAEVKVLTDEEKAKEVALLTPEQQAKLAALEEVAKQAAADKKAAAAAEKGVKDGVKAPKDAPKDGVKAPKEGAPDAKLP